MHKNQTHSCNIITKPIRCRWPVYATDSTSGKGEGKGEGEGNTGIENYFISGCSVIVGQYDNLPCAAAPFKGLQGLVVSLLLYSLKWHCKPLLITL